MNKKVLVITYYWPPSGGVAVQRWLKFSKYLRDFNWEPVIYTVSNGEFAEVDNSLFSEIPENIKVLKHKIWEPYSVYKLFTGKTISKRINRNTIQTGKSLSFSERISIWIRGNLFIPDTRFLWIKPSIAFLRNELKKNKYEAIISTGPPHSNHLIALQLAKLTKLPWLADFRDPWTTMDYFKDLKLTRWAYNKHHKLELAVLKNATVVVVVGSLMKQEFDKKGAKRVEIISNGFDEFDFNFNSPKPTVLDSDFTLVHVGSFLKRRNPYSLWKVISLLKKEQHPMADKIKIKLVGRVEQSILDSIDEFGLKPNLIQVDYVPHNKVVEYLKSAQILLLPIDDFEGAKWVLTGKLFEYLASSRPVLCIGPKEGDAAKVLAETGLGDTFEFDDLAGLRIYLINQFERYKKNTLFIEKNTSINKYSRRGLTERLAALLNEISE